VQSLLIRYMLAAIYAFAFGILGHMLSCMERKNMAQGPRQAPRPTVIDDYEHEAVMFGKQERRQLWYRLRIECLALRPNGQNADRDAGG
jgi:hypothetical protein